MSSLPVMMNARVAAATLLLMYTGYFPRERYSMPSSVDELAMNAGWVHVDVIDAGRKYAEHNWNRRPCQAESDITVLSRTDPSELQGNVRVYVVSIDRD